MTWLVTFAVNEEARPLRKQLGQQSEIEVLITGMGPRRARQSITETLDRCRPAHVLTCGFAGGLDPKHSVGTVLYTPKDSALSPLLQQHGAIPARFHTADRVLISAEEKRSLHTQSRADAVEMESGVIRECCSRHGLPCTTVRVISDSAEENLPLDFNRYLTAAGRMAWGRFALALALSPGRIPALRHFPKQTRRAAERLAEVTGPLLYQSNPTSAQRAARRGAGTWPPHCS